MSLRDELEEQPEVVARVLADGVDDARALAGVLSRADVTHVVVAGRGTSDNAARYAQYVWGELAGLSTSLATPSLYGGQAPPPRLDGAAVVVVSQSGQSPDLVAVAHAGAAQHRPVVAITNDPSSPLAGAADLVVDLRAGPERAVAATKTYTASLVVVAMVAHELAGGGAGPVQQLGPAVEAALATDGVEDAAEVLRDAAATMVLGRGWHLASAHEWALKLQELGGLVAQSWSTADAEHGPVAAVDRRTPLLAVTTSDSRSHDRTRALLARLAHDRSAPVVMACDTDDAVGLHLPLPSSPAPWVAPIVAAPVLQRMAVATARVRGLDPDRPRGLQKVTRTR